MRKMMLVPATDQFLGSYTFTTQIDDLPINFPNQIGPIFTKYGCNSGGCHGKSGGQNGFALSLLGFVPKEDFEHLVKEARGRRLFPAAPDRSLLLLKAAGTVPHGGFGKSGHAQPTPGSGPYELAVLVLACGVAAVRRSEAVSRPARVHQERVGTRHRRRDRIRVHAGSSADQRVEERGQRQPSKRAAGRGNHALHQHPRAE